MKIKEKEADVMELVRRFAKDSEIFTTKIADASIIPVCYPSVSAASQQEMIA